MKCIAFRDNGPGKVPDRVLVITPADVGAVLTTHPYQVGGMPVCYSRAAFDEATANGGFVEFVSCDEEYGCHVLSPDQEPGLFR